MGEGEGCGGVGEDCKQRLPFCSNGGGRISRRSMLERVCVSTHTHSLSLVVGGEEGGGGGVEQGGKGGGRC